MIFKVIRILNGKEIREDLPPEEHEHISITINHFKRFSFVILLRRQTQDKFIGSIPRLLNHERK